MYRKHHSVLVVEDEKLLRDALIQALSAEGFEVVTAENGADGLARVAERHPDLIILDVNMPVMDGIEMLSRLREDEASMHIKVMMLTNESSKKKITEVVGRGVVGYFIKAELSLKDLVEDIHNVLGK